MNRLANRPLTIIPSESRGPWIRNTGHAPKPKRPDAAFKRSGIYVKPYKLHSLINCNNRVYPDQEDMMPESALFRGVNE